MPRKNGVEVRGILNGQFRISPAAFAQRSDEGLIPHEVLMIEERSRLPLETHDNTGKLNYLVNTATTVEAPKKCNFTDRFVVEVCFAVSAQYERAFCDTRDLVIYLATSLNAVALYFTGMTDPLIRFQLNGVIRIEDEAIAGRNICGKALYELQNPCVCAVDMQDTLNKTTHLMKSCQFTQCDVVVRLTSEDLAEKVNDTFINRKIHGLAFLAGVCTDYNVAVAEDDPHTFNGVSTVAHEIAHTLGASHDGVLETSPIEGYPQGCNCSWEDGYLMSFSATGKNMYSLSSCTEAQVRFVVRSLPLSCIEVRTEANYSNRFYPGQNMTFERFCQTMHPEHADVNVSDRHGHTYEKCKIHCCWRLDLSIEIGSDTDIDFEGYDGYDGYDYKDLKACQEHSMLEAMPCGSDGKTCWRGVCGEHNWTEIYNSSHTYRTFQTL
ncbi:venom metalloproteinase antarease TserMP_A-like [Dermacentor albipictus]|uniref:venom metalloproteinase antarease TserMP_A-like n=1 Tax=Dermacentor albipictus TaxID=60249 RepID=UPI0038FCB1DD